MKILILTIATNKYIQFVERLYDNIEEKFLNGHEIQGLLFTEHDVETSDNIKVSQIDHEPWPMPTLKRYNYFVKEKDYISQFDYCYYFDVDMGIVSEVGDEVLGDLVATCMSTLSRNYQLGFNIGSGMSLSKAKESVGQVAEGVRTLEVVLKESSKLNIKMPLVESMYNIIYNNASPNTLIDDLINNPNEVDVEFNY